jgi:hypothetical protein
MWKPKDFIVVKGEDCISVEAWLPTVQPSDNKLSGYGMVVE